MTQEAPPSNTTLDDESKDNRDLIPKNLVMQCKCEHCNCIRTLTDPDNPKGSIFLAKPCGFCGEELVEKGVLNEKVANWVQQESKILNDKEEKIRREIKIVESLDEKEEAELKNDWDEKTKETEAEAEKLRKEVEKLRLQLDASKQKLDGVSRTLEVRDNQSAWFAERIKIAQNVDEEVVNLKKKITDLGVLYDQKVKIEKARLDNRCRRNMAVKCVVNGLKMDFITWLETNKGDGVSLSRRRVTRGNGGDISGSGSFNGGLAVKNTFAKRNGGFFDRKSGNLVYGRGLPWSFVGCADLSIGNYVGAHPDPTWSAKFMPSKKFKDLALVSGGVLFSGKIVLWFNASGSGFAIIDDAPGTVLWFSGSSIAASRVIGNSVKKCVGCGIKLCICPFTEISVKGEIGIGGVWGNRAELRNIVKRDGGKIDMFFPCLCGCW